LFARITKKTKSFQFDRFFFFSTCRINDPFDKARRISRVRNAVLDILSK
jgi:hypothetical protein